MTWDAAYETIATHLQVFRKVAASEDDFAFVDEVAVDAGIFSDSVTNNIFYKYQVKAIIRGDNDEIQYISPDFSPQSNQAKAGANCLTISGPNSTSQ